jgi:class 3 adenylate cyclase
VSVLFADLVGYTSVTEGLDPEDVKEVVERCLARLGREVEKRGGRVHQYLGDGLMAIFGAPVAHEDDAERAVRAGLAMQTAMAELQVPGTDGPYGEFRLRVGVNTGEVLAGPVSDRYTVVGDVVNVASRFEGAARPGQVVVGERRFLTLAAEHATQLDLDRALDFYDRALALTGPGDPARPALLAAAATLRWNSGVATLDAVVELFEEAIEGFHALGDEAGAARARVELAHPLWVAGRTRRADEEVRRVLGVLSQYQTPNPLL